MHVVVFSSPRGVRSHLECVKKKDVVKVFCYCKICIQKLRACPRSKLRLAGGTHLATSAAFCSSVLSTAEFLPGVLDCS